jgi:glycerophosphoryl diester phosphodiesterase
VTAAWGRRPHGAPPLIIGHRGASAHAAENTLAAFRRARADGADGVELDVRPCATGEPVVFHDDDLSRLAGRPERVADLSWAALREVRLAGGEPIPLLAEVLDDLGPLLVNVEIKAARAIEPRVARMIPAVARLVRGDARALVSSFNPFALAQLRLGARAVPTALLFGSEQSRPLREGWARRLLRPSAVHPEHVLCDAARVAGWHGEGRTVHVWTVDGEETVRRVAGWGVDGIITNDPARTRRALAT